MSEPLLSRLRPTRGRLTQDGPQESAFLKDLELPDLHPASLDGERTGHSLYTQDFTSGMTLK